MKVTAIFLAMVAALGLVGIYQVTREENAHTMWNEKAVEIFIVVLKHIT